LSIFEKYDLIKKRNQTLTSRTYAQFWKQTSTAQHRLLSAFDTEKGTMHMAFLQAQVPDPKVITDYKRETFEFQTKDVHPDDQMDLHRKTGEMVFSTLAHASPTPLHHVQPNSCLLFVCDILSNILACFFHFPKIKMYCGYYLDKFNTLFSWYSLDCGDHLKRDHQWP
jgi:hypothetical protein